MDYIIKGNVFNTELSFLLHDGLPYRGETNDTWNDESVVTKRQDVLGPFKVPSKSRAKMPEDGCFIFILILKDSRERFNLLNLVFSKISNEN